MSEVYKHIYEAVCQIPVIDTHEHLPNSEEGRDRHTDILKEYLSHYLRCDLITAGMKQEDMNRAIDPSLPLMDRWQLVEPYWNYSRHTGYSRALDIAVKGIYGIDGIHRHTVEELNESFKKALAPGHFHHVLKDLCNIRLSILDCWTGQFECDRSLFRRVWQPGTFICQFTEHVPFAEITNRYEATYKVKINTLDDWMQAFCTELEDNLKNGIIALKSTVAYERSLHFPKVEYGTASKAFQETLDTWKNNGSDPKAILHFPVEVQNYAMHYVLQKANEKGLAFQFHTGLQEGNGNNISNSNPALMYNLFMQYPDVRFDLFHISYPFYMTAAALCKNFPNVSIDMCWAHIISPNASRLALSEFLDTVPYNKISAFGGDYIFVDGIYGHLHMARENVSWVLAQKVEDGVFSIDRAIDIARALFFENPKRIFRLEGIL
jgi:uncharacterized protein